MLPTSANQRHKVVPAAIFHVIRHQEPRKQWRCTQHCPAHQSSHVFSGRSKTWRTLHQRTQGSPATPTSWRNGTPTTTNSDTNWQQHHPWGGQQQHPTATSKSNGHEISLAPMLWSPKTIPFLLASQQDKLSWLLDQTSLRRPSHQAAPTNSYAAKRDPCFVSIKRMHANPSTQLQLCSSSSVNNYTLHVTQQHSSHERVC